MEAFEKNELQISKLYSLYAEKFPGHEKFWNRLSKEEIGHAREIASLNNAASRNEFQENKFSLGVINYISSFVSGEIERTKNTDITNIEAMNTALRVEQSMLEKKCFDIFSPTNITLKETLEKLNKDTNRHEMVLRKELKKLTKNISS